MSKCYTSLRSPGVLFSAVLSVLLISVSTVGSAVASIDEQLGEAASLQSRRRFDQAQGLYRQVLLSDASANQMLAAQEGLVCTLIRAGRASEAIAEWDNMLQAYEGHPGIADSVLAVAYAYWRSDQYDSAMNTYLMAADRWPQNAAQARAGAAISAVKLADYELASVFAGQVIESSLDTERKSSLVIRIAEEYQNADQSDKAHDLFSMLIEEIGGAISARVRLRALQGLAISAISLDETDVAADTVQNIKGEDLGEDKYRVLVEIGAAYARAGRHEEAQAIFRHVSINRQDDRDALSAYVRMVRAAIRRDDIVSADSFLAEMLDANKENRHMVWALRAISAEYVRSEMPERAMGVFDLAMNQLEGEQRLRAIPAAAKVYLEAGQNPEHLLEILEQYRGQNGYLSVLEAVAEAYYESKAYSKAGAAYQKFIDRMAEGPVIDDWSKYSDIERLQFANLRQKTCDLITAIQDGRGAGRVEDIEAIAEDYRDCRDIEASLSSIASALYLQGLRSGNNEDVHHGLNIWHAMAREFPEWRRLDSVYLHIGMCYLHLEQYNHAASHLEYMLKRWPASGDADYAMLVIGDCYRQLAGRDESEPAALEKAKEAYASVIEAYPGTPSAKSAQIRLGNLSR